jgi:hypothetical protein
MVACDRVRSGERRGLQLSDQYGDVRPTPDQHEEAMRRRFVQQTDEFRRAAQDAVVKGLAGGQSLGEIERAVGRSQVRGIYSPDIAMLELIIAALDLAKVDRARPLSTAGWRERYLPELQWRGRRHEVDRIVYAIQTAAAFRTGLLPDILNDTYSWADIALWPYAARAAVMTIRAIADGRDLEQFCAEVAQQVRPLETVISATDP